jgi:hypothetical protein
VLQTEAARPEGRGVFFPHGNGGNGAGCFLQVIELE